MEIVFLPSGEFWLPDGTDRGTKPKLKLEPMGPGHASWESAKNEVRHQLELAGRISDEVTVETIAKDDVLLHQLI